ncbi:MAG: hypothetical protein ACK5KO_11220 [Arachnia sp.]
MISWSRWTSLALLVVGLGVGAGVGITSLLGQAAEDDESMGMFIGLGQMIAGVGLYFIERFGLRGFLDRPRPQLVRRELPEPVTLPNGKLQRFEVVPGVDPATGEPLTQRPDSSLLFIPLRFWPFIVWALGAVVFVLGALNGASA